MPNPIKAGTTPPPVAATPNVPRIMAVKGIISTTETIASARLIQRALLCNLSGSTDRRVYMISDISRGINLCAMVSMNCSLYSGLTGLCVTGGFDPERPGHFHEKGLNSGSRESRTK